MQSLVDVKYDEWSRVRLSRLLVDYLLREGYRRALRVWRSRRALRIWSMLMHLLLVIRLSAVCVRGSVRRWRLSGVRSMGRGLRRGVVCWSLSSGCSSILRWLGRGMRVGCLVWMASLGERGVSIGDGGGEQKLVEARAHAKKYLSASGDFGVCWGEQLVYWLTGRGTRWSLML